MRWSLGTMMGLAGLWASGVAAAPATTLTVSKHGVLTIPPATVRSLGIRPKRGQLVCVQFPKPPLSAAPRPKGGAKDGHGHDHDHDHLSGGDPTRSPKVYSGLGNDGGLLIRKVPARTATGPIPGKPGTKYRAVYKDGILVLSPAG
jgi:hypothetical protein